jgi:pyruvate decarboxylase
MSHLERSLIRSLPENNPDAEKKAISEVMKMLELAKSPIVIVDGGAARGSWEGYVKGLVEALQVPFFTSILGKGIVNETHPFYGGGYSGYGSLPSVVKAVENSDCILWLGNMPSDFNT